MRKTMISGAWIAALAVGAAVSSDAASPPRAEVSAEIKKATAALVQSRRPADEAQAGHAGTVAAPGVDAASLRSAFESAMGLYKQQPDDAAALDGLAYVFLYCRQPPSADRKRCGKALPHARKTVLKYWAQKPEVSTILFVTEDLEFMDALYEKGGPAKLFVAEMAGGKWAAKFHDPGSSAEQRRRAHERVMKYGQAMAADQSVVKMQGKDVPMTRWKGQGLITSVQQMAVGHVMPDFGFTTLDRRPVSLTEHRGKVLLLDFWATWCKPCVAGMPAIKQFRAEMQSQGKPFEVISVDAGDTIEKVIEFQKKNVDMPWIQWHQETLTEEYFRIGIQGLPTYLALDGNGRILARGNHFDEAMKQKIREALAAG